MRFYSKSMNGFYESSLHGKNVPSDAVAISDDEYKQLKAGLSQGKKVEVAADGTVSLIDPPEPTLDKLAARRRAEIDAERDKAFAAGLPYDIAGEPDVVQTRPQDQINLLGLSAKAQRLIAAGDTETTFTFRGLSNINRELTAAEMDALALSALAYIEGIYGRSWARKDAIDAALKEEYLGDDAKRAAIEAVTW